MPGASIVIDQSRPGPSTSSGSPGIARNDLWQGRQIQLLDGAGSNTTWLWSFLDVPPGSSVVLSGATASTATFTPDLVGTYRIQLVTNGGGPGNVQILVGRVRFDSSGTLQNRGWALPAYGEETGEANYGGNLRGWAEEFEFILTDIRTIVGAVSFVAAGDLSGDSSSQAVIGLQGRGVKDQSPTNGQILTWVTVDGLWEPVNPPVSFTAGGDLTGSFSSQTVVALQGHGVKNTSPTDGQILTWVTADGLWEPKAPPVGFTAGGDLSGSPSSQTVIALQGFSVATTTPTSSQVLEWNSGTSKWTPTALPAALPPNGSASGDLSASYPGPTVAKINGGTVPSAPLLADVGKYFYVSGTGAYGLLTAPTSLPPNGSASGDLGSSYPNPNVVGLTHITTDLTFNQAADVHIDMAAGSGHSIYLGTSVDNVRCTNLLNNSSKVMPLPTKVFVQGISGSQLTASLSSDERGAIVFDPSAFASGNTQITRAIQFVAVLECGTSGQTCSLELYNITDGGTVTTLTTSNTTATIVTSSTLAVPGTLPNSQKLYGLRLTRTGGTTTDLVTCKLARLEVIYS